MEQTRIDVGPATAPARNGAPRLIGGIALWAAAMLAGVLAAAFFVMKSMTWIGGYTGGFWQDDDGGAGLVVGIALVLAWLVLLAASIAVMFRGALRGSRAAHVTAIVLAVVSLVVIGGWLLLLIP